ncbi:MAG TPA: cytochrome P450 [Dehalococcoidia bacterium]|nr:cytochrome P450 [Dehalococcoidia bacterium]
MVVLEQRITLDTLDITDTERYVARGYPWREWDLLRREAPVFWYERPGFEPFWAITRHADIGFVSRNPQLFSNTQRLRLDSIEGVDILERSRERNARRYGGSPSDPPDFIFMDPPAHREYRALTSKNFTPRAMAGLEQHFREMSGEFVSDFARGLAASHPAGEPLDFVHELAAKLPVAAICEMAAIPREDWEKVFHWTEVLIGAGDAEYQRPGEDRETTARRASGEWKAYTSALIEQRRDAGATGDDLVSMLVRAEVAGEPLSERELINYINLLLAAGNETTRNATTGGVQALLQHPDQLSLLLENPSLVEPAVEEILRWTSIVIQFARTCVEDTEIRGQRIRKGETVAMWYPSANRDEAVFEDPYRFDITRDPNPHFAFGGYGEHFCLGANLARWELRVMLRALLPLLPDLELAGPAEMVAHSLHVGGIKRLPVRYRLRA